MENEILKDIRIGEYADLLRIKYSENRDKEIEYQEKFLKAQLQSLGVHTEEFEQIWAESGRSGHDDT